MSNCSGHEHQTCYDCIALPVSCQGLKKNAKRQRVTGSEKWKDDHQTLRTWEGIGEQSIQWTKGKELSGIDTERCRDVIDLAFQMARKSGKSVAEIEKGLIIDVSAPLSFQKR